MRAILDLALASAWNRRTSLALACLSITLATALVLAVGRMGESARRDLSRTSAGVDLVVGPRGGTLPLLLRALFHMGEATATMQWESHVKLARDPRVAWSVPLALGDTHGGYPVIGTTAAYFQHMRNADGAPLALSAGRPFAGLFEAVIGAEVARRLGYQTGTSLILSHGSSLPDTHDGHDDQRTSTHQDKPFRVVGVLAPAASPVDRSVLIGLDSLTALHLDWQGGVPIPGLHIPAEQVGKFDLRPRSLDAVLIGLHQRTDALRLQRQIAEAPGEALMAILPGPGLDSLWQLLGQIERTLKALGGLVTLVSLTGLVAVILAGLGERRRELAILRAVGAGVRHVVALLMVEAFALTITGLLAGLALVEAGGLLLTPWLRLHYGLGWHVGPRGHEIALLALLLAAGSLAGLIPAWRAARLSIADGLTPRL
ncbi:ABC transporter permease [Zoogloea dura]|uniref:ABC transporter permease n=1 Tax=Zoogloea dura TaxID=2728840 RepID=A0A848G252_9RHOO|nr:ABC transporter permease [Zoogloea dura]NML24523.1 ABC transporter permease [Zoogloea dura]